MAGEASKKGKTDRRKLCAVPSCPYRHEYQHNLEFRHDEVTAQEKKPSFQSSSSVGYILGGTFSHHGIDRSQFLKSYEQQKTSSINSETLLKENRKRAAENQITGSSSRLKGITATEELTKVCWSKKSGEEEDLEVALRQSLEDFRRECHFSPSNEVIPEPDPKHINSTEIITITFQLPSGNIVSRRFWVYQTIQVARLGVLGSPFFFSPLFS